MEKNPFEDLKNKFHDLFHPNKDKENNKDNNKENNKENEDENKVNQLDTEKKNKSSENKDSTSGKQSNSNKSKSTTEISDNNNKTGDTVNPLPNGNDNNVPLTINENTNTLNNQNLDTNAITNAGIDNANLSNFNVEQNNNKDINNQNPIYVDPATSSLDNNNNISTGKSNTIDPKIPLLISFIIIIGVCSLAYFVIKKRKSRETRELLYSQIHDDNFNVIYGTLEKNTSTANVAPTTISANPTVLTTNPTTNLDINGNGYNSVTEINYNPTVTTTVSTYPDNVAYPESAYSVNTNVGLPYQGSGNSYEEASFQQIHTFDRSQTYNGTAQPYNTNFLNHSQTYNIQNQPYITPQPQQSFVVPNQPQSQPYVAAPIQPQPQDQTYGAPNQLQQYNMPYQTTVVDITPQPSVVSTQVATSTIPLNNVNVQ